MNTTIDIPLSVARGGVRSVRSGMSPLARKVKGFSKKHYRTMYANDFSVLNPTIWANEAILQLQPNMVLGNLVNRDFDTKVAKFGDIVNSYVPSNFVMTRKGALCDNVVVQDASGSAIQVALDQFPQVAFLICDGEEDRSALDLIETLLVPAVIAMARGVDQILSGSVHQFSDQGAGHLNSIDSTTVKSYVLDARETFNRLNVPLAGRTMVVTPATETAALSLDTLVTAQNTGDGGTALQQAVLGQKYGWTFVMSQTQPEIASGQTTVATTLSALANPGATAVTVASATGLATGMWFTIAADDLPHQITSVVSTTINFSPPLKRAVANGAVFTAMKPGVTTAAYNGTSLHPRTIGWSKAISINGLANSAPQVGQLVTFGTDTTRYSIIKVDIVSLSGGTFNITLDKPLANAVGSGVNVNLGPAGKYNFGLMPRAFTLLNRPIAAPRSATGVLGRTIADPVNRLSIRVTITYDQYKQGHLVVLDTLMGVGVLDSQQGILLAA